MLTLGEGIRFGGAQRCPWFQVSLLTMLQIRSAPEELEEVWEERINRPACLPGSESVSAGLHDAFLGDLGEPLQ